MFLKSNSEIINKTFQTLQSTKELFISSLIYGARYTGKRTLVKEVFQNSTWVDGDNIEQIKFALENNSHIVIDNFQKIQNFDELEFGNVNVVAIYHKETYDKRLENKFAFIYNIPSLADRKDDIKLFTQFYTKKAKKLFDIEYNINLQEKDLDISNNLKSLKKSIYKAIIHKTVSKNELYNIMYNYFVKHYEGKNVYKEQLELFEKALITAGLDIYGSQLKLSDILGINRNTLRKKINEQL